MDCRFFSPGTKRKHSTFKERSLRLEIKLDKCVPARSNTWKRNRAELKEYGILSTLYTLVFWKFWVLRWFFKECNNVVLPPPVGPTRSIFLEITVPMAGAVIKRHNALPPEILYIFVVTCPEKCEKLHDLSIFCLICHSGGRVTSYFVPWKHCQYWLSKENIVTLGVVLVLSLTGTPVPNQEQQNWVRHLGLYCNMNTYE